MKRFSRISQMIPLTLAICLTLATVIVSHASGATIYRMGGRLVGTASTGSTDLRWGSDAFGFDGMLFQAVIELHDNTPDMVRAVDVIFRNLEGSVTIGSEALEITNAEARFRTDHFLAGEPGGLFTFNTTRGEFKLRFDAASAVSYDPTFDSTKPVVLPTRDLELTSASMWGSLNTNCIRAPCPSGPRSSYTMLDSSITVVPEPNSCGLAGLAITAILFQRRCRR
jgi:hypothetical protein